MIDQHELLASSSDLPSPLASFPLLAKYYAAFKALVRRPTTHTRTHTLAHTHSRTHTRTHTLAHM